MGGPAPRGSLLGAQALGLFWGWPLTPRGWLCHLRCTGECLLGPVPPSRSQTSHPSLHKSPPTAPLSPTSCLDFPDMTSKQPRGSLEVLACRLPVPRGHYPHPLSLSRPLPRAGPPLFEPTEIKPVTASPIRHWHSNIFKAKQKLTLNWLSHKQHPNLNSL